ncbi:MAG: hypothetical protein KME30_17220 [Iphinoe sp. HA4291-MV1]|jgi:hypothetical protein|nr:hypothetical protein [Iphinoe sp. HA4291-MV1]
MPTIQGQFNGTPFNGIVRFTPDAVWVDTSTNPDTIISQPIELTITNSSFSGTVPQSQNVGTGGVTTEGITYTTEVLKSVQTIKFYFLDGTLYEGAYHQHTDTFWYTGSIHDGTSKRLDRVVTNSYQSALPAFHAVVPNVGTVVEFGSLVGISTQQPYLDISTFRIADLLTLDPTYKNRISAKFVIKGGYQAGTTYTLNDITFYNGNSYVWINASSGSGQTPPIVSPYANTYWQAIALKGDAGGTGAQIVGYSPATWNGSSEAAARGDVKDAISSIPNPDLSNYYTKAEAAPRANATFTGTTKRDTLSYPVATTDKPKEVPTAQYVEDAIAALAFAKLGDPLVYARRVAQLSLSLATRAIIAWDNRVINVGTVLDTNGNFTVPINGNYLFYTKQTFQLNGAFAGNQTRGIVRAILTRSSPSGTDYGDFYLDNFPTVNDSWQIRRDGWTFQSGLVAGEVYQVRALVDSQQLGGTGSTPMQSSGNSIAPGGGGGANNFLLIWQTS